MNLSARIIVAASAFLAPASALRATDAAPLSALARLPVKEITVFKDGLAYVVHEGRMPTDAAGNVAMDYLPTPILGTFWPYSTDSGARLAAVTARQRRVSVERTALTIRDLLEANPGVPVGIEPRQGVGFAAEIVGVPTRSSQELEQTLPPNSGERLPEKGSIILLKTVDGTSAFPMDDIRSITLKGPYKPKAAAEEFRNLLTMRLDWGGKPPAKEAGVGMAYVQKGIRWLPGYRVAIDGKGGANIRMQATLVNELTDIENANANLVIGVPSFAFSGMPDPMSLQQQLAQLGQYFETDSRSRYSLSNAMMTQVAGGFAGRPDYAAAEAPAADLGPAPEVTGGSSSEDLFVYNVKNLTLRKGERVVLPVTSLDVKYKDVYVLDVPVAPLIEIQGNIGRPQGDLEALAAAPKVFHKIRFSNGKERPLTTAPALMLLNDGVLGQGMMTYTPPGAEAELSITAAVDVPVRKDEHETSRTPNATQWNGDWYSRVDLQGTLTLTNRKNEAVDIEVTRYVLGQVDTADGNGKAEMINALEDRRFVANAPSWWGVYSWPWWWGRFNGVGRFTWKVHLEPGRSVDLAYTWHYFWR